MASLGTTVSDLNTAWRTLCQRWEGAGEVWDDQVRRDFESEFWASLEGQLPRTLHEMERLAQVIAGAQRSVK